MNQKLQKLQDLKESMEKLFYRLKKTGLFKSWKTYAEWEKKDEPKKKQNKIIPGVGKV